MEGGQGDHLACHILADLFLEFGNWKLLDDIFSSLLRFSITVKIGSNRVDSGRPLINAIIVKPR